MIRKFIRQRRLKRLIGQLGSFGENASISPDLDIVSPSRLSLGAGAFIGSDCLINAMGGVFIGDYAGVGSRSMILSIEHRHAGADSIPHDDVRLIKPVVIEDFAWVGNGVAIVPGVRIGEGAIVGMGSVVNQDVAPLSIVMGNPAVVVGSRKREHFEQHKAEGKHFPMGHPCERLWFPPIMKRKFKQDLDKFPFIDLDVKGPYFDNSRI